MAQRGFDILREVTDSRYRLSMVVGRRAAQLKRGVPSTFTGKVITSAENAVSAAMLELEQGSGVRWDDDLPSAVDINTQVQRDLQGAADESRRYSILQDGPGKLGSDNAF